MFRLTREVRFAINPRTSSHHEPPLRTSITNSYAGYPSLTGLGYFLAARVTLAGELDPNSQYLENIKAVDEAVRTSVIPAGEIALARGATASDLLRSTFDSLLARWPALLESVSLSLSPFLTISVHASEHPMTRLSQKFEFSASHRLHNPKLSDDENRRTFGKCNNALGHGHNYEVQATLIGDANVNGLLVDIPAFERTVAETVIDKFDHKHLNTEVPQFRDLIPSVENIAKVIYQLLAPKLKSEGSKLYSVTVWETPKTWCEYLE
jgi:6-pyruvoyltetrahydropterin/6-carboxytetrahydropterin synthase